MATQLQAVRQDFQQRGVAFSGHIQLLDEANCCGNTSCKGRRVWWKQIEDSADARMKRTRH
jgi:hypothetical protein